MELTLQKLDVSDDQAVDEVVELLRVAHRFDRPADPRFTPTTERGRIVHPDPYDSLRTTVLRCGGRVVAVLELSFPQADNLTGAFVEIVVHPDERRRGLGRALWKHAVEQCRAAGRSLIEFENFDGSPAAAFAAALGARPALRDVRRRLVVDAAARARIQAVRDVPAGYELHSWTPPTNPRLAGELAKLMGRLSTDAPQGDRETEPQFYDVHRVLSGERLDALRGVRPYLTVAVSATGETVGWTHLCVRADDPTHAWQYGTLVHPTHRGHRLGLLMKAANLRHVLASNPRLQTVLTWNAESNRHMIAVNEALGFEVCDRGTQWQSRCD